MKNKANQRNTGCQPVHLMLRVFASLLFAVLSASSLHAQFDTVKTNPFTHALIVPTASQFTSANSLVPTSRTVAGHALSSNISIGFSDLTGTLLSPQMPAALVPGSGTFSIKTGSGDYSAHGLLQVDLSGLVGLGDFGGDVNSTAILINDLSGDVDVTGSSFTWNADTVLTSSSHQMSISYDSSGLMLLNDNASPGNSQYYGTDSGGTKGFFALAAATPGGSSGAVQYNNAGAFAGVSGFIISGGTLVATTLSGANDSTALTLTGGSITGSGTTPFTSVTGTWNTTGAPTAIKANITNTASDSGSRLLDLQVGGSSQFSVRKDGVTTLNGFLQVRDTSANIQWQDSGGTREASMGNDPFGSGNFYLNVNDIGRIQWPPAGGTMLVQLTSNGVVTTTGGNGTLAVGANILKGTGTPEGSVTATVGSMFLRTDGGANTTLYIKESGTGNTGWIAK